MRQEGAGRHARAPNGPLVPAMGRPAVNLKTEPASSSLPTAAWKAQNAGDARNTSTLL